MNFFQFFKGDVDCIRFVDILMRQHRFHHLGANRKNRIKRHHGVLENHADAVAANFAHLIFGQYI